MKALVLVALLLVPSLAGAVEVTDGVHEPVAVPELPSDSPVAVPVAPGSMLGVPMPNGEVKLFVAPGGVFLNDPGAKKLDAAIQEQDAKLKALEVENELLKQAVTEKVEEFRFNVPVVAIIAGLMFGAGVYAGLKVR